MSTSNNTAHLLQSSLMKDCFELNPVTEHTDPNKPLAQEYYLAVPVTINDTQTTINIITKVVHIPQVSFDSAFKSWFMISIRKTLEDILKYNIQNLLFTAEHDRLILSLPITSFQENIGMHFTIIESVDIAVPFLGIQKPIHGRSADGIYYEATVSMLYQIRKDVGAITDRELEQVSQARDNKIEQFKSCWRKQRLDDLIATCSRQQLERDSSSLCKLDLEAHDKVIVIRAIGIIDSAVLDLAKKRTSSKSKGTAVSCWICNQDKSRMLAWAISRGLIWTALGVGTTYALFRGTNNDAIQCLLILGSAIVLGPMSEPRTKRYWR